MVPLAGIEPALLAESDFESDASTSSAIGARWDGLYPAKIQNSSPIGQSLRRNRLRAAFAPAFQLKQVAKLNVRVFA